MRLDVNLTNVEVVDGFEPVPEGEYELRVVKGEVKASKSSDYPYGNWQLEIVSSVDNHEEAIGKKVFHITSTHPDALTMPSGLKAMWLALQLPLDEIEITSAIGLTLDAYVGVETYTDKTGEVRTRNNIARFYYDDEES